jgi:signal transduction histidine kinase
MNAKIFQRWQFWLTVALVISAVTGRAQNAIHWTSYTMADGLSEPVFNSVSLTPQNKLFVTSPNALAASKLDGYLVTNFPAPPGNLGHIGESPGGRRWAMAPQGLMEFKDEAWVLHPVSEIAAAFRAGIFANGAAPPFYPIRQDSVLFLLPQGLMEFSEENLEAPPTVILRRAEQSRIGPFTGMALANDGGLWISGAQGLAKITGPVRNLGTNSACQEYAKPDWLAANPVSQPVPDNQGGVILLGDTSSHQKTIVTFEGGTWGMVSAGGRNFFHAWRGPDHFLWAATVDALFQWVPARTNWVENEDISPGTIDDVAVEPDGAFWLATADGLFRGSLPLWSKSGTTGNMNEPVPSLATMGESGLCFIAGDQLHLVQDNRDRNFNLPSAHETFSGTPTLWPLKNGSFLVRAGTGLFQFSPNSGWSQLQFPGESAGKIQPLGILPDGSVCLCREGAMVDLVAFDGIQLLPLANPPPLQTEDLPVTALHSSRNGDLWIGGPSVWWCHEGAWRRFTSADFTTPEGAVSFADLPDGNICCATSDQLWEFDGHNWLLLKTRFNHINVLLSGHDGAVWLASNGGLFRYGSGVWLDNGPAEGLPNGAIYALAESQSGQLWAATSRGVWEYHPEADPDPPRTVVRRLAGTDHLLQEGDALSLSFEGQDKWKYTPADRLLYSYQLDQSGWSAFRAATLLSLPGQSAGRHYFQVRAMDRNGRVEIAPATLMVNIPTPWFREGRLWVVLVLGAGAALFFAAVAWHRHVLLVRSHAAIEQKVAERTRELEIATGELLHSQKMNALGTLAAGIAHDFNNILSIIKGSAQIIEDNPGQPEKIRTRIARIKTVVQQGAEIVEAMLGFSRGSGTPVRCDINAVVADTLKLLGDRFLREAEVEFTRGDHLPELAVSREFIQQILINFIFNAAEAMSNHKKIVLATAPTDHLPRDIFLAPATAPAFVLISVRDQGCGMTPEIQARIFEPFFTTKALSTRRGTGLGLSMVYELAKKMGAGLAVRSAVGQGSEFTLILPVPPAPEMENNQARPAASLSA